MEIRCDCGDFRAELTAFPKSTPGRLVCYCDDCQTYLHYLGRAELLDKNGGTEIVPAYPADINILKGREHLRCTRLIPTGMFRFSTTCCNTPIGNTDPKRPWCGFFHRVFTVEEPDRLQKQFGPVRSSIMGRYAKGTPPSGTPEKFNFKAFRTVMPFLLKGKILGKAKPSPFFTEEGAAIVAPHALTEDERRVARAAAGF